jgi:hypothetical protein
LIICQLPYKNLFDAALYVERDNFVSNEVKIKVFEAPVIENVNLEYWHNQNVFKIY